MSNMKYGLDVGGTKIEIAVYDETLNQVDKWRVTTPTKSYQEFVQALDQLVRAADKKYGAEETPVGIGMAGIVDHQGKSFSGNIPCLSGHFLQRDLQARLLRPVLVENDIKTFTLSEARGGAGEGVNVVLGVIIGTGIGSGLAINGKLFKGLNGMAGEWGHVPLSGVLIERYSLDLLLCGCGAKACVECYVSGPGLLQLSQHFGGVYPSTVALIDAVREGVTVAVNTFEAYLDCLAASLVDVLLHYDPDVIVFGGGMSNVPELIDRLPKLMESYMLPNMKLPSLRKAKFGDSSGVRGAALLGEISCD